MQIVWPQSVQRKPIQRWEGKLLRPARVPPALPMPMPMLFVVFCSRCCCCKSLKLLQLICQYLYATNVDSVAVQTARAFIELPKEVAEIASSDVQKSKSDVPPRMLKSEVRPVTRARSFRSQLPKMRDSPPESPNLPKSS